MNNIDKQYQDLLQSILDYGVEKKDRTGTGTKSIFGYTIRHNMKDGFPLLTTKKMAWKTMVTELLWFLRGDTNIKFLVDNNCHIWDGDAYNNYGKKMTNIINVVIPAEFMDKGWVKLDNQGRYNILSKEEFINKIKTDDEFANKWGELGPIYGKQWRDWSANPNHTWGIDQIQNLINDLKTNPDSRRLMVNAWNVGELDQMVLPPCHYGFQVYTRELSEDERGLLLQPYGLDPLTKEGRDRLWKENNLPTRAISLMWNQRSVDTFLGLPFNIASYGLLLEIIAKAVNMVPDELIGNLGDVHLYLNHIEQAKEQIGRDLTEDERYELVTQQMSKLRAITDEDYIKYNIPNRTREPFPLPTLEIKAAIGLYDFFEYLHVADISDFEIKNYQSHPTIKAPLSN
jgi:thymidylate synthase